MRDLDVRLGQLAVGSTFRLTGFGTLPAFRVIAGTSNGWARVFAQNLASGQFVEFMAHERVTVPGGRCVLCGAAAFPEEVTYTDAGATYGLCAWCAQPSLRATWTRTRIRVTASALHKRSV